MKIKFLIKLFSVILITGLGTLTSCSDEETYTNSPNLSLVFSQDTLTFDTVFTDIGSSTQWLKVFNPNSDGVRISNIKLASEGKSGFYINVDGQSGLSFDNVDIAHKDSVFVFVEVKVDPTDNDSPVLIEDSIVFSFQNGVHQCVHLIAYGQDVIILDGIVVNNDTNLTSNRPYLIYDSLVVTEGCTLTLEEGTKLYFHSKTSLIVHGTLHSKGTLEKPVMMRGDRLDHMFDYLPYDRLDAQWGGVYISKTSNNNILDYTDIHSGSYGIYCDGTDEEQCKITLTNSIIHNVAGSGLRLTCCKAYVANSQISNAKSYCVDILGGTSEFIHCTIAQFYPWKQYEAAVLFSNTRNDSIVDLHNVSFHNCYITGAQEDEIYGKKAGESEFSDALFNYHFENCVLATVIDESDTNFISCTLDTLENHGDNFRMIDTENYIYDFRLDSASVARSKSSEQYIDLYPNDRSGIARQRGNIDAGCYQFQ